MRERSAEYKKSNAVSRRTLIRTAAGAAGFVLCSRLWQPGLVEAKTAGVAPKPIPGGIKLPWGVFIHHYPPSPGGSLATLREPSQITDFNGFVSGSRIFGSGTGVDARSGAKTPYKFMADMGFMHGDYTGVDGNGYTGTFAFIWLDLFTRSVDLTSGKSRLQNQVHDYSPVIPDSGLFWTTPVASESVQVDFDNAQAVLRVHELEIPDWGNVKKATTNGPHVPANVSFDVRWQGVLDKAEKRNEAERWMGTFIQTTATIEWSARQAGFSFISDSRTTNTTVAGVLGRERNGVFFTWLKVWDVLQVTGILQIERRW